MRVLNWSKIPTNKAQATIFNEIKDDMVRLDLDFTELQQMFHAPEEKKGAAPGASAGPAAPTHVSLIGPKRTQSVNIFLKSYRMNGVDVIVALNKFDKNVCTLEFLERLLENIPTPEEIASIDA